MSPVRRAPRQLTHTESNLRVEYLEHVLQLLWPAPATAVPGRGGTSTTDDFVVVPSLSRPRLLVPLGSRKAAATALRRYSEPRSKLARLRLELLALGMATGVGPLLMRDRIQVRPGASDGPGTIETYLGGVLGARVHLSLHIGPARANRKPVLQVLSAEGVVLAFAKIGVNDLTRRLVAAEAAALQQLSGTALTHVEVPRLLHHGTWRGLEIMVQSPLPIWEPRVPLTSASLTRSMLDVARVGGVSEERLVDSGFWTGLGAALDDLDDTPTVLALRDAFGQLTAHAASAVVPTGAWHGDWTPWNMASIAGRVLVWDWERLELGVPLGFDALHHELQRTVVGKVADPRLAVASCLERAEELLLPFGVDPADASAVALSYLVALAVRYLEDGQAEAGARLGVLGQWLLPELVDRVAEL